MFGDFFDMNGDGRSDLFEIAAGLHAMGLLDEDEPHDYDVEEDDESEDEDW